MGKKLEIERKYECGISEIGNLILKITNYLHSTIGENYLKKETHKDYYVSIDEIQSSLLTDEMITRKSLPDTIMRLSERIGIDTSPLVFNLIDFSTGTRLEDQYPSESMIEKSDSVFESLCSVGLNWKTGRTLKLLLESFSSQEVIKKGMNNLGFKDILYVEKERSYFCHKTPRIFDGGELSISIDTVKGIEDHRFLEIEILLEEGNGKLKEKAKKTIDKIYKDHFSTISGISKAKPIIRTLLDSN